MKRTLLVTTLGLVLLLIAAPGAFAFGPKDVVKMTQDGVPDKVIITKIENSSKIFRLSSDDIAALREDGVSDDVIEAMLRTESRDRDEYYDYHGYSPYRSYVYDPYWYPRSSFSFGLGLNYGHRYPYYGHNYIRPRYSPYSGGGFGTTRYRGSVGTRPGWSGSSGSSGSGARRRTR